MQWHRHLMRMFVVRPTRSTLAAYIVQESQNKQSKEDKKLIVDPAITRSKFRTELRPPLTVHVGNALTRSQKEPWRP